MNLKYSEWFELIKAKICWGWCQGTYNDIIDRIRCFCLAGAINDIFFQNGLGPDSDIYSKLANIFAHTNGLSLGQVFVLWNDQSGRTKLEVIRAINKAKEYCLENRI